MKAIRMIIYLLQKDQHSFVFHTWISNQNTARETYSKTKEFTVSRLNWHDVLILLEMADFTGVISAGLVGKLALLKTFHVKNVSYCSLFKSIQKVDRFKKCWQCVCQTLNPNQINQMLVLNSLICFLFASRNY